MPIAPPTRSAPCPQCGKPASLDKTNGFRPFCSERCKLLDLGEWISGRYSIPAVEAEGDDDAPPQPPQAPPPRRQ